MMTKKFLFITILLLLAHCSPVNADLEVVGDNGMKLRLDASTVIDQKMGKTAGLVSSSDGESKYFIFFKLTKSAASHFAEITKTNLGKPIRYFLNGRQIYGPVVRSPIIGGTSTILIRSKADATAILAAMQSQNL